eukprot:superscaffoldBa00001853_g12266
MTTGSSEDQPIAAQLTKQQPVIVSSQSEMMLWTQELSDGELEMVELEVQVLAEDNTAGGLPQCDNLTKTQQERAAQLLAK